MGVAQKDHKESLPQESHFLSVTYPTFFSVSTNTTLHSVIHFFFLSPSENCLGYRNYHLHPLCVFWSGASSLPTKLTDPRQQPNLFSTYNPFQGGERTALQGLRRRGAVFIAPTQANDFKSQLFQSTEHHLLLLLSLGVRGAQQFYYQWWVPQIPWVFCEALTQKISAKLFQVRSERISLKR